MSLKIRKYCPRCGGANIHKGIAYPFDRRRMTYWCGNCHWTWCKPFNEWLIAPSLAILEATGGIQFFNPEYYWQRINRCDCGWVGLENEVQWQHLHGLPTATCPLCSREGFYLESLKLSDKDAEKWDRAVG